MPQGRDYFRPRRLRRKARGAAPHISADSRSSPSLPDEGTDLGRGPCRKGWGQASTPVTRCTSVQHRPAFRLREGAGWPPALARCHHRRTPEILSA
jgi:hypothetical protein